MMDVLLWRKRRTPRWQSLSLAARGAAEGIAVALDERGELSLGWRGLPALAALLGRPWEECEAAVEELLESRTYVYDDARKVIMDPQHVERQWRAVDGVPSTTTASSPVRPLSMTPAAIAARSRRARATEEKSGDNQGGTRSQLTLDDARDICPTRDRTRTDASPEQPAVAPPSRAIPTGSHAATTMAERRGTSVAEDPDPPDPIFRNRKDQDPRVGARATHDPEHPPLWAFDDARRLRPDLSEFIVRSMWRRFATRRPWHASEADAREHLASWLRREETKAPVTAPRGDAKAPPASSDERRHVPEWSRRPKRPEDDDAGPLLSHELRREIAKAQLGQLMQLFDRDEPEPRSMSA